MFLYAVLWVAKTGAPWRDLPERLDPWNSAWRRSDRWSRRGVWAGLLAAPQDPDLEWLVPDTTVIRAHPRAAGAKKSMGPGGQGEQHLGRSRGGFAAKVHAAVSGLGLPARLTLIPGRDADISHADGLLDGIAPAVVVAGKGYDKQALIDATEAKGGEAVTPARSDRRVPRGIDAERFWAKLEQSRRVAN